MDCNFIPKSRTRRAQGDLQNFVYHICHCAMDWTMGAFIEETCARVRKQVGNQKSYSFERGVDSSVTAALLHKAIGDQLTCIFVNNGLLRAREEESCSAFSARISIALKIRRRIGAVSVEIAPADRP